MADRKISDLTALTTPAAGDYLPIIDISEPLAANKNKRITIEELLRGAPDGTAGAPSFAFESDGGNGFYLAGTDTIGASTNGVNRLTLSTSALTSTVPISATSFTPTSSTVPTNGLYLPAANSVALSTNGTGRLFIGPTGQIGISQSSLTAGGFTAGTLRIGHGTGQTGGVLLQNTSTATDSSFWYTDGTDSFFGSNNGALIAYAGGSERLRITSTGQLSHIGAGSTGSPAVSFNGSAPSNSLVITSAGLVGIGTSSPDVRLHSVGTNSGFPVTSGTTQTYCSLRLGGSNSTGIIDFGISGSANWLQSTDRTDLSQKYSLLLNPNGGNVGIGTTPSFLLDLFGTTPALRIKANGVANGVKLEQSSATGDVELNVIDTYPLIFKNANTERCRLDTSGRLLVGTSSTSDACTQVLQGYYPGGSAEEAILKLQRGTASPTTSATLGLIQFGSSTGRRGAEIYSQRDGGTWTDGSSHPGRLVFSTTADGAASPTARLIIGNQGFIFPDQSSADNQGNYLSTTVGGFRWVAGSTATTVRAESTTNSTSTRYHQAFVNPNGTVGSISTSASATAYNTSSDYRLKENVTPVTDGITRLQQLKPSRFNFIADPDKTVDGFIAHEVQTIVPEAITGEKDAVDDDGNPQYQGIDQSKLVPLLTAALQEAIGEIESLKARVAALESA